MSAPMPTPPEGYAACRVHDGTQDLWANGATVQTTHLVELTDGYNMGRPTLCGLTRFDREGHKADLPGWSMGGGISGPSIVQVECSECWTAAR